MADATKAVVITLMVTVPADDDQNVVWVSEVLSRAQLGLALEGYTASVTMLSVPEEA